MEEKKVYKQGAVKGLITSLVIAIIVILGLVGYICYDKGIILSPSDNKITENSNEENKENIETDEQKSESEIPQTEGFTSKLKSYAYATENDQYLLILNDYNRDWLNPKLSLPSQTFTLSEDQNQGVNIAYGKYNIDGDKLELFTTDNQLTILAMLGIEVTENQGQYHAILTIKDNTIIAGNTTLYLK